jgi:hypothetical protein
MSATEQVAPGGALTREQVLDELAWLAAVEHALVVEHLTVGCALGHDLDAVDGGPTTDAGRAAAATAAGLAQDGMARLSRLARALVAAGRDVPLDRAASVDDASGAPLELGTPTAAQLADIPGREEAIAAAVDARYARLAPAVTTVPVFDGDLLDQLRAVVVDDGSGHAAAAAGLRAALGDPPPPGLLRATRRDAADGFEQRLLDAGDRSYGLVVAALRERFAQPDEFVSGAFRGLAVAAMLGLDDVDRLLVQRGLLPAFTP